MTKEELDFIGSMNMCDEISNDAYKKIVCHVEETDISEDCVNRQAVKEGMRKYGFHSPDMTITEFTEDELSPVIPKVSTSDDCVSRQSVLDKKELIELPDGQSFYSIDPEDVKNMSPVTPTHGSCMDCKHNRPNSYARTMFSCENGHRFKLRDCENFYCADFEKRGRENG